MKTYFTKKEQIAIIIVASTIVSILGFKFLSNKFMTKDKDDGELIINADNMDYEKDIDADKETQETQEVEEYKGDIIVHVSGQVKSPGIVELPFGKRLIDAVELLGGLTGDADGDRINLAKKLQDEEKIYIPKIGEELEVDLIDLVKDSNTTNENTGDNIDKIDINICTKEELNSLPGIGPVLSDRIFDYRDENIFKTIEDIKDVSGIGDKKFEGFKDLIIVKWGRQNDKKINRTYKSFRLSW